MAKVTELTQQLSKILGKIVCLLSEDESVRHGIDRRLIYAGSNLGFILDSVKAAGASDGTNARMERFLEFVAGVASDVDEVLPDLARQIYDRRYSAVDITQQRVSEIEGKLIDATIMVRKLGLDMPYDFSQEAADSTEEEEQESEARDEEDAEGPIVGREEDVQILLSQLTDAKKPVPVIAIVGEEGIGKTTLAGMVYNHPRTRLHFNFRVWVSLRTQPQNHLAIKRIASQVVKGLPRLQRDWSAEELEQMLHQYLHNKTYLVTLDNVGTSELFDAVCKLFPTKISNQGRIVITTRLGVARSNLYYKYEVRPLAEPEGWELFSARYGFRIPQNLVDLGKEIIISCMGLPSSISKAADLCKESHWRQVESDWRNVLVEFMEKQLSNDRTNLLNSLSGGLKNSLFYFLLFKEKHEGVSVRRLIALWTAEEFLGEESDRQTSPESVAKDKLNECISQRIIQVGKKRSDGEAKTCRLSHFAREKLHPNFRNDFVVRGSEQSQRTDEIFRLADHYDTTDECFSHIHTRDNLTTSVFKRHYRRLASLLSFDPREGPPPGKEIGNFLRTGIRIGCFKKLRVLDLEGVFRPKLPDSIGKLVSLRYLGLRWTYLQMLPSSVGNLANLQTLDLKRTSVSSLPTSLWKMHQLRHLYLSERYPMPPLGTKFPPELQTLSGAFVDGDTPVKNGLDKLKSLRKLGILLCQLSESLQQPLASWILELTHLESLKLRSINDEDGSPFDLYLEPLSGLGELSSIYLLGKLTNPSVVDQLPQSLTQITLSFSELEDDPMPKLEKLENLKILNFYACSCNHHEMGCSSGGFRLLQVLKFWKLDKLVKWTAAEGALPILREVEIRACPNLNTIPDRFKNLVRYTRIEVDSHA